MPKKSSSRKAVAKEGPYEVAEITSEENQEVDNNKDNDTVRNTESDSVLENQESKPHIEVEEERSDFWEGESKEEQVMEEQQPQDTQQERKMYSASGEPAVWSDGSSKKKGSKVPYIVTVVLLALALSGGVYYYLNMRNGATGETDSSEETMVEEATPTIAPTPTPQSINRSEWTLEVLNGTSTPGLAAKVAAELEEKGYKVVKTGNASSKVDATEVYVSSKMEDKQEQLIGDLEGEYGVEEVTGELEDSTASARIVLGPQEE